MARSHQGSLFACPSVCLCVCLSASMSLKTAGPDFTYFSVHVTCGVTRSSSAGIAICYVFPVSCMTSHFPTKATCRYRCSDATAALLAGYYYYYLKKIFLAHQHKAAGRKTRLDIQNYGCNGNLLCYRGVVDRNRISSLQSHGQALEKECCFPGVFCDSGDTPANLLCELNGHLMPCTSCFYGKWIEDVCTGYLPSVTVPEGG